MITNEQKRYYIELLEKVNTNKLFMDEITSFINTFNGTNEKEFSKLILVLVSILSSYNDMKIDSDALMVLDEIDDNFSKSEEYLKSTLNDIKSDKMPGNVAFISKADVSSNE